ncbi:MAG: alpha/beta hydrolase [Planctomycetota bacterium]
MTAPTDTDPGLFGRAVRSVRWRLLDRFVLRPTRDTIPYAPKRREILSCGNWEIESFVQSFCPEGRDPDLLVLKFPGTSGRGERASEYPASFLPGVACELRTWNPPGYGASPGRASLMSMPQAADAYLSHILQRIDRSITRVWLVGNSLGCVTSLALASQEETIDGVILRNPPALVEVVKRVARRYPLGFLADPICESLHPSMNALITAQQTTMPTLMFQSELDDLVPPSSQARVYEALKGPKRKVILKGIGHSGIPSEDQYPVIAESVRWLWEHSRGPQLCVN